MRLFPRLTKLVFPFMVFGISFICSAEEKGAGKGETRKETKEESKKPTKAPSLQIPSIEEFRQELVLSAQAIEKFEKVKKEIEKKAADLYSDPQVQAARKAYYAAKEKGDQKEISAARIRLAKSTKNFRPRKEFLDKVARVLTDEQKEVLKTMLRPQRKKRGSEDKKEEAPKKEEEKEKKEEKKDPTEKDF